MVISLLVNRRREIISPCQLMYHSSEKTDTGLQSHKGLNDVSNISIRSSEKLRLNDRLPGVRQCWIITKIVYNLAHCVYVGVDHVWDILQVRNNKPSFCFRRKHRQSYLHFWWLVYCQSKRNESRTLFCVSIFLTLQITDNNFDACMECGETISFLVPSNFIGSLVCYQSL